ncbi:MAG: hypothetical protein ABEJ78_07815 [Haloferacaceae archaeon]
MTAGIPVVRVRDGCWHRTDRRRCVASTGDDVVDEDRLAADDVDGLRPKCPLCFDY